MSRESASVEVQLSSLIELALAGWRLQCSVDSAERTGLAAAGRQGARQIHSLLRGLEIEVLDLTGQPYEPGLAVEVVDRLEEGFESREATVIVEMLTPIVLLRGQVVRYGQIVVGRVQSTGLRGGYK